MKLWHVAAIGFGVWYFRRRIFGRQRPIPPRPAMGVGGVGTEPAIPADSN